MTTGVVVGSGPNGLAAAVELARAGVSVTVYEAADTIGGGTRTSELTVPGVLHDHCSAVHPLGAGSPFFRDLDLARHGLEWCHPPLALAHPLDGGRAAVLHRDLDRTVDGLGTDGPAWRRLFGPQAQRFEALSAEILRPVAHLPRHPLTLARFGLTALAPATVVANRFGDQQTRALFAGLAAHAFRPLTSPGTASVALVLGAAGHRFGWPVARGGSRAITDALAAELQALGGRIETGRCVTRLDELDRSDVTLLDVSPDAVVTIVGDRLPAHVRRAYRRYRFGPGAFKVDLAVKGGVPWTNEACGTAGTVHVGGTLEEIDDAERAITAGRMPERPFVLVAQQYLADPSRSQGDVRPVWAYAHVPNNYPGDATEAVLTQIERFAPGLRERIVATSTRSAPEFAAYNANWVGGDIGAGANTLRGLVARPRVTARPYATGVPGVYLCSASTPPGPGVHGMCGANAARAALSALGQRPKGRIW